MRYKIEGHVISAEEVKPDPGKNLAVKSFPLTRLLKAEVPFVWDKEVQFTFESL